ncbi:MULTISPECIES: 3'-5' exonuclease [Chitinibacter]|uniref:3'-5' exonuclease n=1 Tax=Chitinibacter TaxID=230666 RepID=UPI0009E03C6A|nr:MULTISPECIES: 3'-5' exonuclease [Chitinibacter]
MSERRFPPSKDEIALFAPFAGLTLAQIVVPQTAAEFAAAQASLLAAPVLGFDTESRPVFKVGEVSRGPHLVQLTTATQAFLLQTSRAECRPLLQAVLASRAVVKVGFGLSSDKADLRRNFGLELDAVLDLNTIFRRQGYTSTLGVKGAVAVVLGQRLTKSKRVTTSNWANPRLQDNQLLYAANDAYAALQVWQALQLPLASAPIHYRAAQGGAGPASGDTAASAA